jgi:hypothetical protein
VGHRRRARTDIATPTQTPNRQRSAILSYPHLAFAIFFFGLGAWYVVTGEARFDMGGDDLHDRHRVRVNAHGANAVVIGCVFFAVALLSAGQGVRHPWRARFVWPGLVVLLATMLYGLVGATRALASLFGS